MNLLPLVTALGLTLAVLTPAARADMTVVGEFRYVDRAWTYNGWTGEFPEKSVRLAQVLVLDASTSEVLAEGRTDLDGRFSIRVIGSGKRDLVVRALSMTTALAPESLSVLAISAEPYSVSSPVFPDQDLGEDLDVGASIAQMVFSGNDRGNPFNVLDVLVDGLRFVESSGLPPVSEPLDVLWPAGTGTSSALPTVIFLSSDDGYDDAVVLHEFGHVVDFRYSEPDSPGSSHSFGQSDQHPSLSLSEGFATWFGSTVRHDLGAGTSHVYFDGKGNALTGILSVELRANLETRAPFMGQTGGEADELAVAAALWNLVDTPETTDGDDVDDDLIDGGVLFAGRWTGSQLVLQAMRGATVFEANGVSVIDLWNGFFLDVHADRFDELAAAFWESKIAVTPDGKEPDDAPADATPIVLDAGWGQVHSLLASRNAPPVPGAGDQDHFSFGVAADSLFLVETRYPFGKPDAETFADTFLEVYDPAGVRLGSSGAGGVGRNARLVIASNVAGTYRAVVRSFNPSRPSGRYQLRADDLGPVQPPVVLGVSPQQLPSTSPGFLDSFFLTGQHFIGTQSVTVGGAPAIFGASDNAHLAVGLPAVPLIGTLDVVVTNAAGQDSIQVIVVAPDPPAVNVAAGSLFWSANPIRVRIGSEPGDLVYLFFSYSDEPTLIPGVLDLGIGAAGSDLNSLGLIDLGPSGVRELEFRQPAGLVGITKVWVQGAVQRAAGPAFPLVSTNVEPGILQP